MDDSIATEPLSKTAKKKALSQLFVLIEQLLKLPVSQLRQLDLDDSIIEQLINVQTMPRKGARKREISAIRKQILKLSPTAFQEIEDLFINRQHQGAIDQSIRQQAEHWQLRLLASDSDKLALQQWIDQFPQSNSDIQQLRLLIRNAKKSIQINDAEADVIPRVAKFSKQQRNLIHWLTQFLANPESERS